MSFNFPVNPCLYCDGDQMEYDDGQIVCKACLARGPMEKTEAEAILAWNTLGNMIEILLAKRCGSIQRNVTEG